MKSIHHCKTISQNLTNYSKILEQIIQKKIDVIYFFILVGIFICKLITCSSSLDQGNVIFFLKSLSMAPLRNVIEMFSAIMSWPKYSFVVILNDLTEATFICCYVLYIWTQNWNNIIFISVIFLKINVISWCNFASGSNKAIFVWCDGLCCLNSPQSIYQHY